MIIRTRRNTKKDPNGGSTVSSLSYLYAGRKYTGRKKWTVVFRTTEEWDAFPEYTLRTVSLCLWNFPEITEGPPVYTTHTW